MPKQKRYDFKRLQGASSSKPSTIPNNDIKTSVTDRLNELRLADPTAAAQKKREIASTVNQPSVPPALRHILGVPESAPPRARPGLRIRERLRTPGPAPPESWLNGNRHGSNPNSPAKMNERQENKDRRRPEHLFRFARMCGLETPGAISLSHYCMKQLAIHWYLLDEEDYQSLAFLPPEVRSRLLSYLSFYGPAISIEALKALLLNDVTKVDLAGMIGYDTLTLVKLSKVLLHTKWSSTTIDAESWEEELDTTPLSAPMVSSFSTLTHLCLSHPPPTVRWQDLLSLTKNTPALTHLSLAYWPRPTLTPNLTTTTVTTRHGLSVAAGGSDFYSEFDQDMAEPRALLRQLSHNLLRLQWLDIDGNQSWLMALADSGRRDETTGWTEVPDATRVAGELATSWRNLAFIRCARQYHDDAPWRVKKPTQIISTGRGMHSRVPALTTLADHLGVSKLESADSQRHVIWILAEQSVLVAVDCINTFRAENGCHPIVVDLGWNYV